MMFFPSFASLLAIIGLALVVQALKQPGFVHRRHLAPAPRAGSGPRKFDITKRAPSHHELAQLGGGERKREVKSAQGGMVIPLQLRAKKPSTALTSGRRPIEVHHSVTGGATKMQQQSAHKGKPTKIPQDNGGSGGNGGSDGGSDGGGGTPSSNNPPVIMDDYLSFNATIAGTPVVMVVGGSK